MSSSHELAQANTLNRFEITSASRSSKRLVKSVAFDRKIALNRTERNIQESTIKSTRSFTESRLVTSNK
jgi:hypothetical protein